MTSFTQTTNRINFRFYFLQIYLQQSFTCLIASINHQEGISRSMLSLQGILSRENIEEMLSFVPIEKNSCFSSVSDNHMDASHETESSMSISRSLTSKNKISTSSSSPDVVIVVNTQNHLKKMLISRRSSYQKVLALEKEGVQVVERDVNLPLDLVFSAAVCLVWYETRNLGDSMTISSSISAFVETIATNILMSLSFAFSGCILVTILFYFRNLLLT